MNLLVLCIAMAAHCATMTLVTPPDLGLQKPRGLSFADGTLWVADTDNNRVVGLPVAADGTLGAATVTIPDLEQPFDVAAGDGKLYIAESGANEVSVFDRSSAERTGALKLAAPRGVHVLSDGRIAATSAVSAAASKLVIFGPEDGSEQAVIGEGLFDQPWGIAEAPGKTLFVGDAQHKRIARFGIDGKPDGEFVLTGSHLLTALLRTESVLLACESTAQRVVALDPDTGKLARSMPTGAGTYPQGLALSDKGHLFIALTGTHQIAMIPLADMLGQAPEELANVRPPTQPEPAADPQPKVAQSTGPRIITRDAITVVAFGDSVTFGAHMQPGETYPEQLQALLETRYGAGVTRVINAGIGGNTSSAGLARLDADVLAHKPDFVLINFGLNDSAKTSESQYKAGPEQYKANLIQIVQRVREAGAEPILATITPVLDEYYFDRHPREFYAPDGGLQPLLQRYNMLVREVAEEQNVGLADWHRAITGGEQGLIRTLENSGSKDGVHPTPEGYRALALEFFLKLQKLLER